MFGHHDLLHHLRFWDTMYSCLVDNLLLHERGAHITWTNRITGDPMRCSFESCNTGQSKDTMFGRNIGRFKLGGSQGMHRCDVDDPTPLLRVHSWQDSLGQQEGCSEHDI